MWKNIQHKCEEEKYMGLWHSTIEETNALL